MEEDQQPTIEGTNVTGLLTAAAIISTILLLVSASRSGSSATASDPHERGAWGIASWTSSRARPLDPHERRWQTALLSGKDNASRWRDLVAEVEELERMSGAASTSAGDGSSNPANFDSRWVDDRLDHLEATVNAKGTTAETSASNGRISE